MTVDWRRVLRVAVLLVCVPAQVFAQRSLHWDTLSVAAHLDADGSLRVTESQTMVFTGDWNGGERTFDIRPRQQLVFDGMARWNGAAWQDMSEDSDLDDVDDFAWTDSRTLRWRSRQPSDPPFRSTSIRYELRYRLLGGIVKDGDTFVLNHDFAFADRDGVIDRVEVRLTLDPAWQATTPLLDVYGTAGLEPGRGFVVTVPLRYSGEGTPAVLDLSRPPAVRLGVLVLLAFTFVAVLLFFAREQWNGRFAPVQETGVDESWIREHILKYPAEVVSAAWDDSIGTPEVVTLLARMTSEGKLESRASAGGSQPGMSLRLTIDRSALDGYERELVDALFFDGRTTTSTDEVKAHYREQGFNPVSVIQTDLRSTLDSTFPFADAPWAFRVGTVVMFVLGLAVLARAWWSGDVSDDAGLGLSIGTVVVGSLALIPGWVFRMRIDWGYRAALLCLIPAFAIAGGTAAFLWFYAGSGAVELTGMAVAALVALAVGATNSSINALRSRQRREGIALRKTLAAGRRFFQSELQKPQPAMRDEWYPWVLAFELENEVADWSANRKDSHRSSRSSGTTSSGSSASSSPPSWTGFGGGRSGGAGAGASWAAAAGGLAAGVAAPRSSGSSGGSSGGGSSSSGGGGGGGW